MKSKLTSLLLPIVAIIMIVAIGLITNSIPTKAQSDNDHRVVTPPGYMTVRLKSDNDSESRRFWVRIVGNDREYTLARANNTTFVVADDVAPCWCGSADGNSFSWDGKVCYDCAGGGEISGEVACLNHPPN